jgi:predicted phage-related endonuclease
MRKKNDVGTRLATSENVGAISISSENVDTDVNNAEFREMYTAEQEQILDVIYEREKAINTMTKEIKPMKKFITDYIGKYAGLITGKYRVSYKQETVTSFDSTKFKVDFPQLYEQYSKTSKRRKWLLELK